MSFNTYVPNFFHHRNPKVLQVVRQARLAVHAVDSQLGQKYKVDQKLIDLASNEMMILHCLPAHRGEEITEEALEGKQSYVFDQAENRLHIQHALLAVQLGGL